MALTWNITDETQVRVVKQTCSSAATRALVLFLTLLRVGRTLATLKQLCCKHWVGLPLLLCDDGQKVYYNCSDNSFSEFVYRARHHIGNTMGYQRYIPDFQQAFETAGSV